MLKIEQFDKNVALDKAMNLFWYQGYKETSLTDLINTLGIKKQSLYNTFKSKRTLFEKWISVYTLTFNSFLIFTMFI
jgi:AcrR family transcriptional regulator